MWIKAFMSSSVKLKGFLSYGCRSYPQDVRDSERACLHALDLQDPSSLTSTMRTKETSGQDFA